MSRLLALLAGLVVLVPLAAPAQSGPGQIGVFLDPEGTTQVGRLDPFTPVSLYVVVFDPPEGMTSFAFELHLNQEFSSVHVWSELLVPGMDHDEDPRVFQVQTDGCVSGEFVPLARINLLVMESMPFDLSACVTGGEDVPFPHYTDCEGAERSLVPTPSLRYGTHVDGCTLLNLRDEPEPCCPLRTHEFWLPRVFAEPGTRAVVPLSYDSDTILCRSPPPCNPDILGFGGTLSFDPQLLELAELRVADPGVRWTAYWEIHAPGRIHFWAHGDSDLLADLDGAPLLELSFDVLAAGTAEVVIDDAQLCGDYEMYSTGGTCAVESGSIRVVGSITQEPVSTDATSFGTIKTRFVH